MDLVGLKKNKNMFVKFNLINLLFISPFMALYTLGEFDKEYYYGVYTYLFPLLSFITPIILMSLLIFIGMIIAQSKLISILKIILPLISIGITFIWYGIQIRILGEVSYLNMISGGHDSEVESLLGAVFILMPLIFIMNLIISVIVADHLFEKTHGKINK